jgi:hypothetical protein
MMSIRHFALDAFGAALEGVVVERRAIVRLTRWLPLCDRAWPPSRSSRSEGVCAAPRALQSVEIRRGTEDVRHVFVCARRSVGMFEGQIASSDSAVVSSGVRTARPTWDEIDRRLRAIAARRTGLDLDEARWLRSPPGPPPGRAGDEVGADAGLK